MNNNDAAARAALYTEDAVEVTDHGPIVGREAIEKHYADMIQKVHFSKHVLTDYSRLGLGSQTNQRILPNGTRPGRAEKVPWKL
jgi:hypothetical protein